MQGHVDAQNNLAVLYSNGQGVPEDWAASFEWASRAAELGLAAAQLKIGGQYFLGRGAPVDYVLTYKWVNLAVASSKDLEEHSKLRDAIAQKILRKLPGNWTFVVVTDRRDLDDQIYKNFAGAGVVTEQEAQATSGAHLRQLLSEDHRYVFTLIQKFRAEPGELYPALSDRSDIIVITDEAHRSQYDTLALNMRTALPNASFLAFTGTPLIVGEERTKEVFGDYVSVYNFRQSIEDGATVPLYYENRIPELELTNEDLNEDMETAAGRGRAGRGTREEAGTRIRPAVSPRHTRRSAGKGGARPRDPLHLAGIPGQGDGGVH